MKENVEVVVKIGFKNKEMTIMTTSIKNVKYCVGTTCNGNVQIYSLYIYNARIIANLDKQYNAEYGREIYTNRDEDLWVYESPEPIEFYITRTTTYESPEEDDSKYATLYDSNNRSYMKVKTKEDEQ